MTGVQIVGSLLGGDAAVLNLVEDRLKAGALPDGIALPALLVRLVSSVERQPLRRGMTTRTIDRVSVTVRASNYREQAAIIKLVKACCPGKTGNIGGASSVSILTAGTGPDVIGPASSFEQTQDFRVSYDAGSTPAVDQPATDQPVANPAPDNTPEDPVHIESLDWAP